MQSIIYSISDAALKHPDNISLCVGGDSITYDQLIALANGIRRLLDESSGGKGQRIGVLTDNDTCTYASLLAVLAAGNAYVPLNRRNPLSRNLEIMEQAGVSVVLSSRDNDPDDIELAKLAAVLSTKTVTPDPGPLQIENVTQDDLAYLFFTSGSTGKPKGVPIHHRNLSAFMSAIVNNEDYSFSCEDRFLQMFELTFDLSVMSIFAPWCVGACCCVVPDKGIMPMETMETLDEQKITVALMVPSVLSYVKRYLDEIHLQSLRLSLFCGEALPHDLVTAWSGSVPNARIENVYGPTEATIFCTRYKWIESESASQSANGIVPIGEAMTGVRTEILDENGKSCSVGDKGELCLAGDQVISEYWNNEEATNGAFHELPTAGRTIRLYRTGDIVYEDERGDLIYCGRADSQVKIDGHRIELGEIEHYARKHAGHSMAAVLVKTDELSGGSSLTLFVQKSSFSSASLAAYLVDKLPDYMQPREIRIIDEMPLNQNGKIDRKALAAGGL